LPLRLGTALAATLIGAGIGVATGGLIEALANLGITDSPARAYSDRFSECEYLVMVNGTDDEVCPPILSLAGHTQSVGLLT